jgi:hypothetical protein
MQYKALTASMPWIWKIRFYLQTTSHQPINQY